MRVKTKILFTVGSYGVGGKERQMTEIIKHLSDDKYEIHLFFKNCTAHYFDSIKDKLKSYFSLESDNFKKSDIFKLKKYIAEIKPDVVFSFSEVTSIFCLILNKLFLQKINYIDGSIRNASPSTRVAQKLFNKTYNLHKYVVANSYAGLEAYNQLNKKNRFVLYNGFSELRIPEKTVSELRKQLNLPLKSFIVSFVAKQDERKDHITFLNAIRLLSEYYDKIHFVVVGDGNIAKKNMLYAKEIGIYDIVNFRGMSDHPELYLKAVDLNVLCSSSWHGEGIPNSILESFANSTLVIATDNGGTKEILKNCFNGFIVNNGDYKELANKILLLYNDKKLLYQYSINAFETYKNKFTIEKMINKFEEIITLK